MKYLLFLLGRMFLTLKHAVIKFINTVLKLYFKTNIQDTNIIENMFKHDVKVKSVCNPIYIY